MQCVSLFHSFVLFVDKKKTAGVAVSFSLHPKNKFGKFVGAGCREDMRAAQSNHFLCLTILSLYYATASVFFFY